MYNRWNHNPQSYYPRWPCDAICHWCPRCSSRGVRNIAMVFPAILHTSFGVDSASRTELRSIYGSELWFWGLAACINKLGVVRVLDIVTQAENLLSFSHLDSYSSCRLPIRTRATWARCPRSSTSSFAVVEVVVASLQDDWPTSTITSRSFSSRLVRVTWTTHGCSDLGTTTYSEWKGWAKANWNSIYPRNMKLDSKTASFYKSRPSKHLAGRAATVPCAHILGGGSSINFMMYTRASASDCKSSPLTRELTILTWCRWWLPGQGLDHWGAPSSHEKARDLPASRRQPRHPRFRGSHQNK